MTLVEDGTLSASILGSVHGANRGLFKAITNTQHSALNTLCISIAMVINNHCYCYYECSLNILKVIEGVKQMLPVPHI